MKHLSDMSWKELAEYHCYAKMRKAELVEKWRKDYKACLKAVDIVCGIADSNARQGVIWFKKYKNSERETKVWQLIALIFLGGFLYLVWR